MLVFTFRVEDICLMAPDDVNTAVVPDPVPLVIRLDPVMFEKPEILPEKLPLIVLPLTIVKLFMVVLLKVNPDSVLVGQPATNPGAVKVALLEIVALPEILRFPDETVRFPDETVSPLPTVSNPENFPVPVTSKVVVGLVLLIPTFPAEVTTKSLVQL